MQLKKMLLLIAKTKTNGVPHGPLWDTAPCGTFNSIVNSPATFVHKGRSSFLQVLEPAYFSRMDIQHCKMLFPKCGSTFNCLNVMK